MQYMHPMCLSVNWSQWSFDNRTQIQPDQSSELRARLFTCLYSFCIFFQSSSVKRTGSIWPSCIHFLGINGRRGEEGWVPLTFAFFLSQKSSRQGRRPPFSTSGHFFPQGEGHPFLRGIGIHTPNLGWIWLRNGECEGCKEENGRHTLGTVWVARQSHRSLSLCWLSPTIIY